MTKSQLIEALEDYSDDAEIRVMHQPSWPFEYAIQGTWVPDVKKHTTLVQEQSDGAMLCDKCLYDDGKARGEGWETGECDAQDDESDFTPHDDRCATDKEASKLEVVYLVEGSQLAYGSKTAFEECGKW